MENSGLISVIIPVYNVEKYLKECVDSVLKQTYENYEIILVNDGSTDGSGSICDEYAMKSDKITVIHKENGGLSKARNAGLALAKGEYIYFLDSDDYIVPEAFDNLISVITAEKSDFVFFDALSFMDEGSDFNIPQKYVRKKQYKSGAGLDVLSKLIENKDFHSAVPLCFIKRSFLEEIGLKFVSDIFYEDMIFTYQLFMVAKKAAHCYGTLYHRRHREASIMTSEKNQNHFDSVVKVYEEVKNFSEKQSKDLLAVSKKYIIRCAFNVFNIYEKLNDEDKNRCKKQLNGVKKAILKDNAYGDKALKMRCYGKVFWFIYKVFEKTVGRLFV